jgi:hypothetical protein
VGRTITFHNNYWHNTRARLPLFRFGEGHVFNNYYLDVATSGVNSRMGAQMRVDGNVFENVANPITSRDSPELGFWDVADNTFINVTPSSTVGNTACVSPPCNAYLLSTTTYTPSYDYSAVLMPSSQVAAHVTLNAGTGIHDCLDMPDTAELPVAPEPDPEGSKEPPEAWNIYNANSLPDAAASIQLDDEISTASFTLNNANGYFATGTAGTVNLDSSANAGNNHHATLDNVVNNTANYPKQFTVLAGVTGNSDDIRVLEIEVAMADDGEIGRRLKTILRADGGNQGVQFERTDCPALATVDTDCTSVQQYGLAMTGFRVWQISITLTDATTGDVRVYGDGNDTPLLTLTGVTLRPTSSAGHNFLRFGDGGSNAYKANIDWIIWTDQDAYRPSDLIGTLPAGIGVITGYEDN